LVDGLAKELGLNATVPYRPWFEDKQVRLLLAVTCCNCSTFHQQLSLAFISVQWFNFSSQVGGWTQVYGDILTFATIRGAGHLAPLTSPKRSLALFSAFLSGKPLPEALPN
jgi:serine carboxypeptidase-like clade 2